MRWEKRGKLYDVTGEHPWDRSYALLPTPYQRRDGGLRVYYATLDDNRFGHIAWIDLDPDALTIVAKAESPVLEPGVIGTFDDSGVNPSSVVRVGSSLYLYYVGWQRSERVPYVLLGGLAISNDDGDTFTRFAQVPVLERTRDEPFIRSAPSVLIDQGQFRAWYVSASGWEHINGTLYPVYEIRHAVSSDGIEWKADASTCLKHASAEEFGFGRPWVVKEGQRYRMWYSVRSRVRPYRIGYAESNDGLVWERHDDHAGIEASASGWDSEMICYAAVFTSGSRRCMLYNGNRHGSTGFGLALERR